MCPLMAGVMTSNGANRIQSGRPPPIPSTPTCWVIISTGSGSTSPLPCQPFPAPLGNLSRFDRTFAPHPWQLGSLPLSTSWARRSDSLSLPAPASRPTPLVLTALPASPLRAPLLLPSAVSLRLEPVTSPRQNVRPAPGCVLETKVPSLCHFQASFSSAWTTFGRCLPFFSLFLLPLIATVHAAVPPSAWSLLLGISPPGHRDPSPRGCHPCAARPAARRRFPGH